MTKALRVTQNGRGLGRRLGAVPAAEAALSAEADAVELSEVERLYSEDVRGRVWSLYLRGLSYRGISAETGVDREAVARVVRASYAEMGDDHVEALRGAQDEAIARLRHIQRQAWSDHDLDAQREAEVLAQGADGPRFISQRAAYLRLVFDCEREIARLHGLYGVVTPVGDAPRIIFDIQRAEVMVAPVSPAPPIVDGPMVDGPRVDGPMVGGDLDGDP